MLRTPEDDILKSLISQHYLNCSGKLGERENAAIVQKAAELGLPKHKIYELKLEVQRESEEALKALEEKAKLELAEKAKVATKQPLPKAEEKPKPKATPKPLTKAVDQPKERQSKEPQTVVKPQTKPLTTQPVPAFPRRKLRLRSMLLGGILLIALLGWVVWLGSGRTKTSKPNRVTQPKPIVQPKPEVLPPPSMVGFYQGKVRGKTRRLRIRFVFPDSTLRYGLVRPGRETAWLPGKLQGQRIELDRLGRGTFHREGDRYILTANDGKWTFESSIEK